VAKNLRKSSEGKTSPNRFRVGPSAMAWIERAQWTISSESKIKPNGQKLVENLVGEVVILTNGGV
jgi:hypothetical protein